MGRTLHQARGPQVAIGADGHRRNGHVLTPGLNHRLQRVGITVEYIQAHGHVPRHGAKAARRVGDIRAARHAHHPRSKALQHLLRDGKMLDFVDGPRAHHELRRPLQNGQHQHRDVRRAVLIVRVRVDDHVGPRLDGVVQPRREGARQPAMDAQAKNMIDPMLPRDLHSVVGRSVVDDKPLHHVESRNLAGKLLERDGQGALFVVTRYLDDQFVQSSRQLCRDYANSTPRSTRRDSGAPRLRFVAPHSS